MRMNMTIIRNNVKLVANELQEGAWVLSGLQPPLVISPHAFRNDTSPIYLILNSNSPAGGRF